MWSQDCSAKETICKRFEKDMNFMKSYLAQSFCNTIQLRDSDPRIVVQLTKFSNLTSLNFIRTDPIILFDTSFVEPMWKHFAHTKQLKHLLLDQEHGSREMVPIVPYFLKYIGTMSNLETLALLDFYVIDWEGFECLGNGLTKLESLHLKGFYCENVQDASSAFFSWIRPLLCHLRSLTLEDCLDVAEGLIKAFNSTKEKFDSLTQLSLNSQGLLLGDTYDQVTPDLCTTIFPAIRGLTSIDITGVDWIIHHSRIFESICDELTQLRSFCFSIPFHLYYCPKLYANLQLVNSLRKLKFLDKIAIYDVCKLFEKIEIDEDNDPEGDLTDKDNQNIQQFSALLQRYLTSVKSCKLYFDYFSVTAEASFHIL
jgi:hypothetical protein